MGAGNRRDGLGVARAAFDDEVQDGLALHHRDDAMDDWKLVLDGLEDHVEDPGKLVAGLTQRNLELCVDRTAARALGDGSIVDARDVGHAGRHRGGRRGGSADAGERTRSGGRRATGDGEGGAGHKGHAAESTEHAEPPRADGRAWRFLARAWLPSGKGPGLPACTPASYRDNSAALMERFVANSGSDACDELTLCRLQRAEFS